MGTATALQHFEFESDYILRFSDIEVNVDKATVRRAGQPVSLTATEFELLNCLLMNPGRNLSRDTILEAVWSYLPSPNTRTVDAHMLRLRQKLEKDPNQPEHFLTIYRIGYCFRP